MAGTMSDSADLADRVPQPARKRALSDSVQVGNGAQVIAVAGVGEHFGKLVEDDEAPLLCGHGTQGEFFQRDLEPTRMCLEPILEEADVSEGDAVRVVR